MRIFKNKWFTKFAAGHSITDDMLRAVVREAEAGTLDADYGGGVIKQRLGRPNEGKSGGYRIIIFYRVGDKAFLVYGFSKSERANIDKAELQAFKKLAKITLAFTDDDLAKLIKNETYKEIK